MAAKESPVTLIATCGGSPLPVQGSLTVDGPEGKEVEALGTTAPGGTMTLTLGAVPAGKVWRIRQVEVTTRAYAAFSAKIGGGEIASGKTNPATPTVVLPLGTWLPALSGQALTVVIEQATGAAVTVGCRFHYTEHPAP